MTTKFQVSILKLREKIDFKINFKGIVFKVCALNVILTLARNNIFSFRNKFLVAEIILHKKQ